MDLNITKLKEQTPVVLPLKVNWDLNTTLLQWEEHALQQIKEFCEEVWMGVWNKVILKHNLKMWTIVWFVEDFQEWWERNPIIINVDWEEKAYPIMFWDYKKIANYKLIFKDWEKMVEIYRMEMLIEACEPPISNQKLDN